jgi:Lrp/AsnC family leucine-responsive transcriptional regulator
MRVLPTKPTEEKKLALDSYDKKILFALAQNCRTPYSQIGKNVGLSRDSVRYRIQRLHKSTVIQGYRTIVDVTKLGYMNVHIFLQLNQPDPEAERKLVEIFKSYPFVRAIIKFNGKYDFELALIAKNFEELDNILSQIISDCGPALQHYEILPITKSFVGKIFPDSFLKAPEEEKPKQPTEIKLDEKDYKLLSELADNAEQPLYKIAEKVDLSADAVKYRLRKLRESGVITGFVPVINYDIINFNVYAILLSIANFTSKKEATLKEFLKTNKDILWAVKTIGKYNVLLYICTTNPDALIKTTADLRSHFIGDVRDYETLINYEEYKYTYFPSKL